MSVTEETDAAQRLLALCKEYTEVIGGVKQEAESVAKQWTEAQSSNAPNQDKQKEFVRAECYALAARSNSLRSAVGELIRAVSQRVEHSRAEFEERLELKIRLADLEGSLNQTLHLVNGLEFLVQ